MIYYLIYYDIKPEGDCTNGNFRNLNWRYLPYIRPMLQAYVREYPHNSYGQTYGTNVPPCIGSWRSPIDCRWALLQYIAFMLEVHGTFVLASSDLASHRYEGKVPQGVSHNPNWFLAAQRKAHHCEAHVLPRKIETPDVPKSLHLVDPSSLSSWLPIPKLAEYILQYCLENFGWSSFHLLRPHISSHPQGILRGEDPGLTAGPRTLQKNEKEKDTKIWETCGVLI